MAPLSPRVTAQNTSSIFGLPTPQTISHARSRTDSASESLSVAHSGSSVLSLLPRTPSPFKTKIDTNYTARTSRTTPQSQRIVPSSQTQYFADEQTISASLLEGNADGRDPFLLPHPSQHDRRSEDLALPSLFKLPLYPLSRAPTASSSLPSALVSSSGCGFRYQSQNSQIEPTSQFEEVELRFSSDAQATPPQAKNASLIKRYFRLVILLTWS